MQVFIENSFDDDLTDFCDLLIKRIKVIVLSRINGQKLSVRDVVINNPAYKLIDFTRERREIESISLYQQYLYNLRIRVKGNTYIIESDPNIKIFGSNTTVDSIIRAIEYGKLGLPAYPLIRTVYDEIAEDIPTYYQE